MHCHAWLMVDSPTKRYARCKLIIEHGAMVAPLAHSLRSSHPLWQQTILFLLFCCTTNQQQQLTRVVALLLAQDRVQAMVAPTMQPWHQRQLTSTAIKPKKPKIKSLIGFADAVLGVGGQPLVPISLGRFTYLLRYYQVHNVCTVVHCLHREDGAGLNKLRWVIGDRGTHICPHLRSLLSLDREDGGREEGKRKLLGQRKKAKPNPSRFPLPSKAKNTQCSVSSKAGFVRERLLSNNYIHRHDPSSPEVLKNISRLCRPVTRARKLEQPHFLADA